ncbi:methyltransferase [Gordonia jinhuaensis]|uniref:SAM-dependent methyltransferase n=1 Tax=Gordonia jinhuaensis TaxID=1517702 RepID=A0A916WQU9_9ACTN|nr:methyltransferase [Gordonia jinhuaensis]GGB25823.1 SAM-dependent methyltransferase [Gordonia jinhuaensis]
MTTAGPGSGDVAKLYLIAEPLREAFDAHHFDADGILDALGPDVHAALGRGEPVPVRRAARGLAELGTLIRLFLLADTLNRAEVAAAIAPLEVTDALACGLLLTDPDDRADPGPDDTDDTMVRTAVDVRPLDIGHGTRWLFSDLDGSMRPVEIGEDHVLGVGHASLSLLTATIAEPCHRVLDLGTGCGVQAVAALDYADHVTATDITDRSLAMARAGLAINRIDATQVDLARGPWFEPVAGQRFDRIVANPPFVVGPPRVTHSYRDSGLDLDGASQIVISQAADHLTEGGTASLLASWAITSDDWRERVASWVPDDGVQAWILQRDVADPALYVGTWLRDAGYDPRTGAGATLSDEWLEHFERSGVRAVGFGFVYLRRVDGPSEVIAEEMMQPFDDPLGPEAADCFARTELLRTTDLADAHLQAPPTVVLEEVSALTAPDARDSPDGPQGPAWDRIVARLHRTDGPRWSHETDDIVTALLAGLRRDGLSVGDTVALLEAATGADLDAATVHSVLTDLIRHGFLR